MASSSRTKSYGWASASFIVIYKILEWISGAGSVVDAWMVLEKSYPNLSAIPSWLVTPAVVLVAAIVTIVGLKVYLRRRLTDIDFPQPWEPPMGQFANDPRLQFDYLRDPSEVAELAKTEDYGDKGQTDVEIATGWWKAYQYGNVLAKYSGTIIGGIDIWPITKKTYSLMLDGTIGDLDLRGHHFQLRKPANGSYWYVGSVSLGQVFRFGKTRRELLLRLFINAMQSWFKQDPVFPATFVAIAWTDKGTQLLIRQKFRFHPRLSHGTEGEPTYTKTFDTPEKFEAFLSKQKRRLAEHN